MRKENTTLVNCGICDELYQAGNAKVVGSRNNSLVVHIHCDNCQSSTLTIISKSPTGENIITMGMLTDLDYEEAVESMVMKAIDANEVLDIIADA